MKNKIKVDIETLIPTMITSLNNNQIVELKVKGSSMYPTLRDGKSIVGLKKYDGVLKKKRIYFYKLNEKYILHRYISTRENVHNFMGDALYTYEHLDNDNSILAYVEYIKNKNKKINPESFYNRFKLFFYQIYKQFKSIIRKEMN